MTLLWWTAVPIAYGCARARFSGLHGSMKRFPMDEELTRAQSEWVVGCVKQCEERLGPCPGECGYKMLYRQCVERESAG